MAADSARQRDWISLLPSCLEASLWHTEVDEDRLVCLDLFKRSQHMRSVMNSNGATDELLELSETFDNGTAGDHIC